MSAAVRLVGEPPASVDLSEAEAAPIIKFRALRILLTNPNAVAGLVVLSAIVFCALSASYFYPGDPLRAVGRPLLWPGVNARFPLGTDSMGRDLMAGLFHGARTSLLVGLLATIAGLLFGMAVGALAGFCGGVVDTILVRFIELFQTIPSFVLLVVIVAIATPSTWTTIAAIAIISWPAIARLTRAEFRSIKNRDFVVAARSLGFGTPRILFYEILPNALSPIIVTASVMVASAILTESAVSFLGLGDPNLVSWGSMVGSGRDFIRTAWYLTAIPGLTIVFTVLSLNMIGDGLNDALNPRSSEDR